MEYTLDFGGIFNVYYLTAPYALLVEAFGNDGTVSVRDAYKSEAQWDSRATSGDPFWEVYDYKPGKSYNGSDGLDLEQITTWNVQADEEGKLVLLAKLDAAVRKLTVQEIVSDQLEAAESFDDACRKANGEGVEQDEISALIAELGDGGTIVIGETDKDGFYTTGGMKINLDTVRVVVSIGGVQDEQSGDIAVPLSLDEVRKAHALLGAYLVTKDQENAS